ncbi:hypothetical protein ES703_51310 [subsurface metagenome]
MSTRGIVKILVFGALLAGAGAFLGLVLRWAGDGWEHLIPPTWDALYLGIWFLGALVAVAVAGGLVAVLLRPFWVAAIAFAVSALAMFLTWEISVIGIIVAAIYFLTGLFYVAGVRREIENRIRFSVWHIMRTQLILLVMLTAIACSSLYFGYAAEIEREGFSIPEGTIDWVVETADEHIIDRILPDETTPAERQDALDELRDFLEGDVESDIEPYEGYIPVGLAAIVFGILTPAVLLISWIPLLILALAFFLLTRFGVVKKVAKAVEVIRLSIE